MAHAYCYQSGHIDVAATLADVPTGTIIFASGKRRELQQDVSARARHARGSDVLLVPGVPEAATPAEAFKAFIAWQNWAFPDHTWRRWG